MKIIKWTGSAALAIVTAAYAAGTGLLFWPMIRDGVGRLFGKEPSTKPNYYPGRGR